MTIVSVPKDVWTLVTTATGDTIVQNLGHSEVFISTTVPTLATFDKNKLDITAVVSGDPVYIYSVGKDTDINYFLVPTGVTNLSYTAATRVLASSTGADVTLPLVSSGNAGLAPASGGGTTNFLRADGTWTTPASPALTDLTDVTISGAAQGQVLTRGASEFQNLSMITFTIGPFFQHNIAAADTAVMTPMFFETASAVARALTGFKMQKAGRVVGGFLMSQSARTAGTATLQVRVNGTNTTFNSGSVVLNATDTQSSSSIVAYSGGVSFAAGDTLTATVVTNASWSPTTDFTAYLVVMLEPF